MDPLRARLARRLALALLSLAAVAGAGEEITRADLARAYLRFEQSYARRPPADLGPFNRGVRGLGRAYVRQDFEHVLSILDGLTARLDGAAPPGVRVRPVPRVSVAGTPARLELAALYPETRTWTVRLRDAEGGTVWQRPARWPASFDLPPLPPGAYDGELVRAGQVAPACRVYVMDHALDDARAAHDARLATVKGLPQAVAACRARNALLVQMPADDRTVHYLIDPRALALSVGREVKALAAGRNPYRMRVGETWRVVRVGGADVPLRVYAPAQVKAGKPLPVVVALHGAGGDENLFLHGYGGGRLRALADEHGFIAVTPLTYRVMTSDRFFDAILDMVEACYPVDAKRVYLVGHSLGAITSAGLAVRRKDRIAAVALLAGGGVFGDTPPMLLYAAELDHIFPPARMRPGAEFARREGKPVEFRLAKGQGHLLMVGAVLPETIAWLLAR